MATNVSASHCFKDKVRAEGAVPRARQARVGKELAGMAADLPLNMSSSVFLRVDEKHMMLWKALITGGCWAIYPFCIYQQPCIAHMQPCSIVYPACIGFDHSLCDHLRCELSQSFPGRMKTFKSALMECKDSH